jgi:hypothetical protein
MLHSAMQLPLPALPWCRYRLQLREADQRFFEDNVMSSFLPQQFHLSTQLDVPGPGAPAEAAAPSGLKHGQNSGGLKGSPVDLVPSQLIAAAGGGAAVVGAQPRASHPLNNETWWRIYQAASFVGKQLHAAEQEGVSLPDWVNHMLKCCYVVVMTARDESASFRIFSTLNGRGMDLSVVDKLKADWLQVRGGGPGVGHSCSSHSAGSGIAAAWLCTQASWPHCPVLGVPTGT